MRDVFGLVRPLTVGSIADMSLHTAWSPNSALLTNTYSSPLRAQRGAAKRER
jgi:hypothetical protein